MKETRILFAGFGGQGVLFSGRLLATMGMLDDKSVTWMPSYGAEMRGGTSNCAVVISDGEIDSPMAAHPDILIAMNIPSILKFEGAVKPGGLIVYDSSLVKEIKGRGDVTYHAVPATQLADDNDLKGLGNLIMLGKVLAAAKLAPRELTRPAMERVVSARRIALLEANIKALDLGYSL